MIYRGLTLLTLLLINSSVYSQDGYPRQIVYKGDTIVAITRHQMQMLNIAHLSWQECTDINDSLLVTIDSCKSAFTSYDDAIRAKDSIIALQRVSIHDRDTLIITYKQDIVAKNKTIRKLRVYKGLMGILAIVEGIIIGWLLLR